MQEHKQISIFYHQLFYHFLGTNQSEDILYWIESEHPKWIFCSRITKYGKVGRILCTMFQIKNGILDTFQMEILTFWLQNVIYFCLHSFILALHIFCKLYSCFLLWTCHNLYYFLQFNYEWIQSCSQMRFCNFLFFRVIFFGNTFCWFQCVSKIKKSVTCQIVFTPK